MAATTQRHRQTQQLPPEFMPPQRPQKRWHPPPIVPGLKAGKVGGLGLMVLMLGSLIPPAESFTVVSRAVLVVPVFLVVALITGLLAGVLADDQLYTTQQSGEVGWLAGFWAGVFGGIFAMYLAARGVYLHGFGQSLAHRFAPAYLGAEITPEMLALAGRVLGALLIYGIIGALVAALVSAIGGMIYFKLKTGS